MTIIVTSLLQNYDEKMF